MAKAITVQALNLPAIQRQFSAYRAAAPNAVAGQSNVTAKKVVQTAKSTAPVRDGQYKDSIRPKFATRSNKLVEAEARANAPHSRFVEAGTGTRGRGTWKQQISDYMHGGKPGMKATNNLWNAWLKHMKGHRDRIADAVNKGLK